ncbi:MAG: hypothetical protein KTR30_25220 [Saprospiraceae bacterium]|nr:hypothetical protein [Saprospiraceae bacterium]
MKITAILLAFYIFLGSLLPGTDYGQFLHIGDLIQHAQVHKLEAAQLGEEFSWKDFVYDHFINPDHHEHSDHTDHHELPFHVIHGTVLAWVDQAVDFPISIELPQVYDEKPYLNPFHLNGFQRLLKQPPALV